ncbi:hypothetical protein GCM10023306_07590 [Novosphingobium ginsenosidimutans]
MSDLSSDIGGSDEYAQVLPILAELAKILAAAGIGAYINSLFNDEVEKANAERDISSKYGNTSIVASTTTDGKLFVKGADGWWYSDRDGNGKFDTRTRESATAIEVDRGNGIVFFPKSGS